MSERVLTGTAYSLWYHFGPQGETRYLTNMPVPPNPAAIVDSYLYTAYGEPVASSGTDRNAFRYGGQVGYYTGPGAGIVLCGVRWYNPWTARWMTRDPIGYAGGADLYAYCGESPVGGLDADGLDGTDCGTSVRPASPVAHPRKSPKLPTRSQGLPPQQAARLYGIGGTLIGPLTPQLIGVGVSVFIGVKWDPNTRRLGFDFSLLGGVSVGAGFGVSPTYGRAVPPSIGTGAEGVIGAEAIVGPVSGGFSGNNRGWSWNVGAFGPAFGAGAVGGGGFEYEHPIHIRGL